MNSDDIWLMSDQSLKSLKQEIKEQKKLGVAREQMAVGDYRYQLGDVEVMRIHGPIISRPNWITELLGLRTTEEHMDNLSDMLAGGSDVLLDIDTGGGNASLAFEFADMIASGGERVIAYSGGYAASAGMLFLTAAHQSFAHRSATLGSIGVVGYGYFGEDDDDVIYSDNAANKKGNKASVKRDINETEKLFHEYVERGTGMSREQIISLGREGDIFNGDYADTNGFISGTTTLQELTSNNEQEMALATSKELEQAQAKAMQAMASRFMSMTSIEGVPATVSQLVACNVAIDEADGKALLTAVATEISAAYERGKKDADAKPADAADDKKADAPDQGAVMALLTQMQAAMSAGVNKVEGDNTDGNKDTGSEKSKEELAQEDWNARLEKMKAHAANGGI